MPVFLLVCECTYKLPKIRKLGFLLFQNDKRFAMSKKTDIQIIFIKKKLIQELIFPH